MKSIYTEIFNEYEILSIIWRNRPCWIAVNVVKMLGYQEYSYAIGSCIERENFQVGIEYDILEGRELRSFKELLGENISKSIKYAPKLIVFYEQGLYGFLAYTEKPLGVTFRTWIREEVVPQIRATGAYVLEDDYYDKTYNSDIEFTCENEYDGKVSSKVKEKTMKDSKLSVVDGKYIEVDKLNCNSQSNDFDIDKFQRLRMATESAKLLKDLLDDVDTDSICKLAVVKTLFSEAGIELPIYFNKSN